MKVSIKNISEYTQFDFNVITLYGIANIHTDENLNVPHDALLVWFYCEIVDHIHIQTDAQ